MLLWGFTHFLEPLQARIPKPLQKRAQVREPLGPRAVEASRSLFAFVHQARAFEHRQMLRDRGPRDVEMCGDRARG